VPVVVTGAETPLGRAVLHALCAREVIEVRATVREIGAAAPLRADGVPTSVSDLSDPLQLGAVLDGAHTVVHLDRPLSTWQWLLEAAEDTGVRRIVTVLPPGTAVPEAPGYELMVVTGSSADADPAVVAAVLSADARLAPAPAEQQEE
jgi:uncharacterized protein YbjT (DUF2867 family)